MLGVFSYINICTNHKTKSLTISLSQLFEPNFIISSSTTARSSNDHDVK